MRYVLIALAVLLLGSCSVFDTEVQHAYSLGPGWTTGAAFTTADVRIITERTHPVLRNTVLCTEPSPDVAKALAATAALTAQGGNGTASGSLGASGASAEALVELAGRSSALLALRDGLFRACEAYANGVIGQDDYALVISRYSQVMTTLFLGQDITGAAGAEGKAAATSAALQALGSQQASGTAKDSTTTTTTPTPPAAKKPASTSDTSAPGPAVLASPDIDPRSLLVLVADSETAAKPTAGGAPKPAPAPAAPSDASKPAADTTAQSGSQPQPAAAAAVSTAAALTLGRMNEDYFDLDANLLHLLVIACISQNDPTRLRRPLNFASESPAPVTAPDAAEDAKYRNKWLDGICGQLDLNKIIELQAQAAATRGKPINPEVAAVPPPAKPAAGKATPNN